MTNFYKDVKDFQSAVGQHVGLTVGFPNSEERKLRINLLLEEVKEYQRQRAAEYPSLQAQQDMQYWDAVNGTTTWVDTIAAVKAKYPKAEPDQTEIDSRKATAVFDLQLAKYKNAVARLAQIELSKGGTVTRVEKTLIGQSVDPVTFEMSDIFDEQVLETVVPAVEYVEH